MLIKLLLLINKIKRRPSSFLCRRQNHLLNVITRGGSPTTVVLRAILTGYL
jgi:hypothetical protein